MTIQDLKENMTIDHRGKKDFIVSCDCYFMINSIEKHQHAMRKILSLQETLDIFERTFTLEVLKSVFELKHDYELNHLISNNTTNLHPEFKILLKRI